MSRLFKRIEARFYTFLYRKIMEYNDGVLVPEIEILSDDQIVDILDTDVALIKGYESK